VSEQPLRLELAGSPTTWGVDFADHPLNPPWQRVLDEIAEAGCRRLELGPVGYLPQDPDVLRGELDSRGLSAVGTFLFQPISRPEAEQEVLAVAARTCQLISEMGGRHLVIVDQPSTERAASAGQGDRARRLDDPQWVGYVDRLLRIAEQAQSRGVRAVLHPHAGTYVEFADEIDAVFARVPAESMGMCLDTGHLAYAGVDIVEVVHRYRDRIEHVHLKDVDGTELTVSIATARGFWESIEAGIFCPVGQGMVDFPAFIEALAEIGYRGSATIEQDRHPASTTDPKRDLERSVAYLTPLLAGD
jgi:inosose dehydratase